MDLGIKDRVALVAAARKGIGFTAARELARDGALVFVCSRGQARASEEAQKIHDASWATQGPMGRIVRPEEIAAAIAFLASERASSIAGVTLQVDGGWVKGLF